LCASGARGLEEAAREKWAALLLDIGLPDVNGLTVLERDGEAPVEESETVA
jgi:DNA-binding response OmpR family regulator